MRQSGRFSREREWRHPAALPLAMGMAGLSLAACGESAHLEPRIIATVEVTPSQYTLAALGETHRLTATAKDGQGNALSDVGFAWTSSNESVATVDESGMVTGVGNGETEVTATASGVSGTARIAVNQTTALRVLTAGIGTGSDADGVTVTLSGTNVHRAESPSIGGTILWDSLAPGTYTIELEGLATHCHTDQSVTDVTLAAELVEVTFTVACVGQFAYGRWFSQTRADVHYLDEHGNDRLLSQGGFDIVRSWSPNGQHLLVERWIQGGCDETYRVSLDGNADRLMPGPRSLANSSWSPAGDRIAVQDSPCPNPQRIEIVLVDAQSLEPLDTVPGAGLDQHPTWSPDGSEVAFVRTTGVLQVYAPASGELIELAPLPRAGAFPVWSPDGEHIALILFGPQQTLLVERATGAQRIITGDSIIAIGGAMTWFPDGRTIGFVGLYGGAEMLFTVNVDEGVTRTLADDVANRSALTVSSRSDVLFVARPGSRNELFVARTDGANARLVKSEAQHLVWPLWRTAFAASGVSASWAPRHSIGIGAARDTTR